MAEGEVPTLRGPVPLRVVIFGATGMVGQGMLRECLLDPEVTEVLTVGRTSTGQQHAKLREILHPDLFDLAAIDADLAGYDACFYCLGVSSSGMPAENYRRLTYDLTLSVARRLLARNPDLTFVYISGQGTDSSERRSGWAGVKGRTENVLLALSSKAYMFRPGYIRPMHGATSKTALNRWLYVLTTPLYPVLRAVAPKHVTTTEQVGRAMLTVARQGAPKRVLETSDINAL
jgi:uncharacterized protein YbjT (DUF2867 family)